MQRARPSAAPNAGFLRQLKHYAPHVASSDACCSCHADKAVLRGLRFCAICQPEVVQSDEAAAPWVTVADCSDPSHLAVAATSDPGCALRQEEEKEEGVEKEVEQQASKAQANLAIDCGICEPITVESQPSLPPLRAEHKKKRSVDFLLEGKSVQTNRHLARFAAAPYLDRLLTEPAFSSMLSRTSKVLRKELIEAYVVVEALEKMLALGGGGLRLGHSTSAAAAASPDGIGVEVNDPPVVVNDSELTLAAESASGQGEAAAVVDLCCGKGFLSVILALEYPDLPVIMVDSNERKSLHLASLLSLIQTVGRVSCLSLLLHVRVSSTGAHPFACVYVWRPVAWCRHQE